jgi:repressor of nif and glnA expression
MVQEKEFLASQPVPKGMVGIATVCGIVVNAALTKSGIPVDSRFGGVLQYRNGQPWRFTESINYDGCSLDPSEIFINSGMTQVRQTTETGEGKILANFREVPAVCLPKVKKVVEKLKEAGIGNDLVLGEPGKPVCEIPVGVNKVGLVLAGGLNPIAAACEEGIKIQNKAMSSLIELDELRLFWDYLEEYL